MRDETAKLFFIKKILSLFVAALPSLVFALLFTLQTNFFQSEESYSTSEIIKWIFNVRPLIIYAYNSDMLLTTPFFFFLLILLILKIVKRKKVSYNSVKTHFILLPLFLSLLLLFLIPEGSGAGMMSTRLIIVVYMFVLLFIIPMAMNIRFNSIIIIAVVLLHVGLLLKHLNGTIKKLDKHAQALYETSNKIDNNSIVLPVNLSDHWIELHLSNYLGADKPLIILENYEAGTGWFPVSWNEEEMPQVLLANHSSAEGIAWPSNIHSSKSMTIDDVVIFGNIEKLQMDKWDELRVILSDNFRLDYTSPDRYVWLYKRISD
ncbi:MAG: hypothetical protein ACK5HT_19450 [Draconibacterium sp.]